MNRTKETPGLRQQSRGSKSEISPSKENPNPRHTTPGSDSEQGSRNNGLLPIDEAANRTFNLRQLQRLLKDSDVLRIDTCQGSDGLLVCLKLGPRRSR